MRVSDNKTTADNIIKLVECLKKIEVKDVKIGFYAEKMFDGNGNTISY